MSPKRPQDTNPGGDDESNSLVAFRRFVDDQVDMAFQGLHHLPRIIGSLATGFDDVERDARQAWQRFNDSFERSMNPERRQIDPRSGEQNSTDTLRIPHEYDPADSQPRAAFTRPYFMHTIFPFDSKPFLKYDPYSPLVLEEQETREDRIRQGRCRRTRWRHAYEDLVVASRGESIPTAEDRPTAEEELPPVWIKRLEDAKIIEGTKTSPGLDRLESLMEKFEFPCVPQYGDIWYSNQDETSPATELDLYEQFLQSQAHASDGSKKNDDSQRIVTKVEASPELGSPGPSVKGSSTPSILSTLTTTHRRTMPDGSIRTRRVLTKRFADGHEETEETINTTRRPTNVADGQIPAEQRKGVSDVSVKQFPTGESKIAQAANPERRKGGWFWSSS